MRMKTTSLLIVQFIYPPSFVTPFSSINLPSVGRKSSRRRFVAILSENGSRSIFTHGAERSYYELCIKSKKGEIDDLTPKDKTSSTDKNNAVEEKDKSQRSKFRWSQFTSRPSNQPNLFYLPPIQIEDTQLVLYDVFLLTNLAVCISFCVCHRMELQYIGPAFSEGVLLSILWIVSGLYYGTFLYSSINGHYNMDRAEETQKGGPLAAGTLALSTFVTTSSLRIIVALAAACLEHRPVGVAPGEELIPLEIGFGLVLMSAWRYLWSETKQV